MNLPRLALLLPCFLLLPSAPALAQVDRVAMRTTGITCGTCAFVSEVYLRQLSGIDAIKISLSTESILVTYKPNAVFQPKDLRDALKKTDVGVLQFQVSARGRVHEQDGKRFLVAGRDRFVLAASEGLEIPLDTPISVEAMLNDLTDPMQLKVMTVKRF